MCKFLLINKTHIAILSNDKITEISYTGLYLRKFFLRLSNITGREGTSKKKSSSLWLFLIMRKEAPKSYFLQQPELRAYSFKDGATYNVSGTVEGYPLRKEIHCRFGRPVLKTNCHYVRSFSQSHLI